jgi:hypothetical protein
VLARANVEAFDRPLEFGFRLFAARQSLVIKRIVGALGHEREGVGIGSAGAGGSRKQRAGCNGGAQRQLSMCGSSLEHGAR